MGRLDSIEYSNTKGMLIKRSKKDINNVSKFIENCERKKLQMIKNYNKNN